MPVLALLAVLIAAIVHAIWNVLAKRAVGSRHFVWLYSLASLAVWAPAIAYVLATTGIPGNAAQWFALLATGVLHLGYALSLQAGYRSADLSIVYPIARGFGPLLSFVGAVLFLGDLCSPASVLGLALILAGTALVSGLIGRARRIDVKGASWGLATGTFIAGYTLNDAWAVRVLLLSPTISATSSASSCCCHGLPATVRAREPKRANISGLQSASARSRRRPTYSCCSRCGSRP